MKKTLAIISALVMLGMAAFAKPAKSKGTNAAADGTAQADKGKVSIAVPAPKAANMGEGADWIPLFIQGIITTNFQQYSGLTVIDRQNADMVKAEQRLSESAEFDEKNAIELGKMTNARLIVTGNIMAKSNAYALTFSITDAQTGETKASASVPNCLRSALEDGTAANQISYDLMAGYGIALNEEITARLTQATSTMTAATSAQASVAKGIIAEQSGSNIEALTYYIQARKNDNRLSEAASRMAGMTTVVTGGNFGANAKNMMKLHDDWDKLLLEAAGLIAANPPEFGVRYFTDIEPLELTEKDYANKTMSFRMGAPYLMQTSGEENFKIAEELMDAMHEIPESDNWGDKMNGFPWTYADDIPGDHWLKWVNAKETKEYPLTVVLLDADKNLIASRPYTLYVRYDKKGYIHGIKGYINGKLFWLRDYEYFTISSDNKIYGDSLPSLTISDVPVGNADTDKIYISVENAGSQKISVLPTDALPADKAISVLEAGSHNGTVKVGGFLPDNGYFGAPFHSPRPFALDLYEGVSVLSIRSNTFTRRASSGLLSVTLPKGTRKIDSYAFSYCVSLRSIIIPESVIVIASSMCSGSMPAIYYAGSKEQWKKIEKKHGNEFSFSPTKYNYKPQDADSSSDGKKKKKK